MEKKYSISDASRQVEVENHVLRYWEEELGLNIHRNSKGHRFYTDRDIKILRDVKDLKEQGFLLKSIKLIIHDIDNVRKMNPNEQYKLREELNQKIQDEEENNSNKAKAVNGFMISRSQSVQTDNVVQLENKNMSGAAGQVLNIQKGELGQTAFKQGEQRSVAVPSSLDFLTIVLRIISAAPTSIPRVGSSRISTSGSANIHFARSTFC